MNVNLGKVHKRTPRVVLTNDRKRFGEYIVSKKSKETKKNVSQNLHYAFNFYQENYPNFKSVLEITPDQFKAYFQHLEARILRDKVKGKYRLNLGAFIKDMLGETRAYNEKSRYNYDYIFSNDFFKFTDTAGEVERDALSLHEIFEILTYYENRSIRDFVLVSLLAYSGGRVGGLCALKINDIDLTNRTFQTQEKPTQGSTGWNRYFFPRKFKVHLESYLVQLQFENPDQELLFPIETKTVRKILSDYSKRHVNPHLFRDAINTYWMENGFGSDGLRSIMLNQKPTGVNAERYFRKYVKNDKSGKARLKLYDQYFPY
ncbi:tyrosine-type recombinase/integrase [Candidatus Lokiarchaeum ossiferum]|uniref:tyrosine-type recombinase/integrase n=1 Tax=Candidatus Lokiarchaeum ossiferum TaxID=2951803 RepID=UPI00352D04FA